MDETKPLFSSTRILYMWKNFGLTTKLSVYPQTTSEGKQDPQLLVYSATYTKTINDDKFNSQAWLRTSTNLADFRIWCRTLKHSFHVLRREFVYLKLDYDVWMNQQNLL
jgi:hypothetical protein